MKVCVIGSGGREHAFVDALAKTSEVIITPGNPGIPGSIDADPFDVDADLYVVGPEAPLVDGLADRLRAMGKSVFGPGAAGAQLEGSKRWMKEVLAETGVPTARFGSFDADQVDAAVRFLGTMAPPFVVKTDGLAAGKGVLVTEQRFEAEADIREKLSGATFGDAGRTVVIEEGLSGPEVSLFALCDGREVVLVPTVAQDHKRLLNGDEGPNTGGMGCYSPVAGVADEDLEGFLDRLVRPTVGALRKRGIDYRGVLFAGLMLTHDGPRVLEYNVRFGDPEAQVILPRIESDVAELFMQVARGRLVGGPKISGDAMVSVVCASEGYPAAPRTGDAIEGIDSARELDGVTVFAAGVASNAEGELVTAGGRVLSVCGRGDDLSVARERAYAGVDEIGWRGMQYRTDIAAGVVGPGTNTPGAGT